MKDEDSNRSSDDDNFKEGEAQSFDEKDNKLDQSDDKHIPQSKISQVTKNVDIVENDDFNDNNFQIELNEENNDNKNNEQYNIRESNEDLRDTKIEKGKKEKKEEEKDEEREGERNRGKKIVGTNEEKKKEKSNISVPISYLNQGNDLILKKKKDIFIVEIDAQKTSEKVHTVYQIKQKIDNSNQFCSNINKKDDDTKILCYRRYKDFDKFYNTLKFRFPHCVFSRLSQKDFIKTKVKEDSIFMENRRKELQYFINKLYYHEQIGKSEEFKNFLYYSTFDEQYFRNRPKKYSYPECEKIMNDKGYLSLGMEKLKMFSGFSKQKEYPKSDLEKEIINRKEEFLNKDIQYNNLLKEVKDLFNTTDEEVKELKSLSNNLLYLKDNNSPKYLKKENDHNKNKFNELINLNQNFSDVLEKNSLIYLAEIVDQLNYCILDVEGINRAIERYIKFIEEYKKIQDINVKNNKFIIEEKEKSKNDKIEFEKSLFKDIQKYDKENNNIYEIIVEKIVIFIKQINGQVNEAFENSNFLN